MPNDGPVIRQWILLRTLCARHHGVTVKELIEELGVSDKTVRRDLEMFQQIGFPLAETVEDHGRKKWRIDAAKNQPGLAFAFDEAVALYLGRRLLEPLAGTVFWEAAQRAFRKIRATLGEGALGYLDRFAGMFHHTAVGASDYHRKAELIDRLMMAIEDRRQVLMRYQSLRATEPVTYDVFPYGLAYHRGSLYLVGWAPGHQEIRHWKVDRIEDVDLTDFPFDRPADFDLAAHFSGSFGVYHGGGPVQRIRVAFSAAVARYVTEGAWHASQRLHPQPDGGVHAHFELDNTEELKRWLLGFGRHARVLEPDTLRGELLAEAEAMIAGYQAPLEPVTPGS